MKRQVAGCAVILVTVTVASAMGDGWTNSKIPAPPRNVQIAADSRGLAAGDFDAVVAKGGPTRYYVWGHLHARHKGRTGSTRYSRVAVLVLGDDGYPYFIGDPTTLTVGGRLDAPDNNKHRYFSMKLTGESVEDIERAIANDVKFRVYAAAERNRSTIVDHLGKAGRKAIQEYLSGELDKDTLIKILKGKFRGPA